jgi:hypothetical protein
MEKIISVLEGQKVANVRAIYKALVHSGIISADPTAHNAAALVVAVTAPPFSNLQEYVLSRLSATNEQGETFGEILKTVLSIPAQMLEVSQIAINTSQPWMRISTLNGEVIELEGPNFQPQAIRTDAVICGGLVAALSMKLAQSNVAEWKE